MKPHNDQKISLVLKDLVANPRIKKNLNQTRIQEIWKTTMGDHINRYTKEISVSREKLYLKIDSAPLKQELSYGKAQMMDLLNEALGEEYIRDVIIL